MINQVVIYGRLTKDAEYRKTQNDNSVASFSVAVNGRKISETERETYYFNCTAFNRLADFLKDKADKGTAVVVAGSLTQRSYNNLSGQKIVVTEIIASDIQIVGTPTKADKEVKESKPTFTPEEAYKEAIDAELGVDPDKLPF